MTSKPRRKISVIRDISNLALIQPKAREGAKQVTFNTESPQIQLISPRGKQTPLQRYKNQKKTAKKASSISRLASNQGTSVFQDENTPADVARPSNSRLKAFLRKGKPKTYSKTDQAQPSFRDWDKLYFGGSKSKSPSPSPSLAPSRDESSIHLPQPKILAESASIKAKGKERSPSKDFLITSSAENAVPFGVARLRNDSDSSTEGCFLLDDHD